MNEDHIAFYPSSTGRGGFMVLVADDTEANVFANSFLAGTTANNNLQVVKDFVRNQGVPNSTGSNVYAPMQIVNRDNVQIRLINLATAGSGTMTWEAGNQWIIGA